MRGQLENRQKVKTAGKPNKTEEQMENRQNATLAEKQIKRNNSWKINTWREQLGNR